MMSKVLMKKSWGRFAYLICTPDFSARHGKYYNCVTCTSDGTWTGSSDVAPWEYAGLRHLKVKDADIPSAVKRLAEWLETPEPAHKAA